MDARTFAVERLGVGDWPATDTAGLRAINPVAWKECVDRDSAVKDPVTFAFDVSPDRSSACVAVAGARSDGLPHIEVVEHLRGTHWVVQRIAELVKAHKTWAVMCDPAGPAGSLVAEVQEHVGKHPNGESKLDVVTAREYAQACGLFYDEVEQRHLRHGGTSELNTAVDGAQTRPLGEAWAWSRKVSTCDITPLVACTLALYGNSKRPKRRVTAINLNAVKLKPDG